MLAALKVLASDPGLVAITLTELNPHNAALMKDCSSTSLPPSPKRSAIQRVSIVPQDDHQPDWDGSPSGRDQRTAQLAG
jgi:hypothetical protein